MKEPSIERQMTAMKEPSKTRVIRPIMTSRCFERADPGMLSVRVSAPLCLERDPSPVTKMITLQTKMNVYVNVS